MGGFLNFLLSTTSITSCPDLLTWYSLPDCVEEWYNLVDIPVGDTAGSPVHIKQVPYVFYSQGFDISFDKSDSCFFLIRAFVGNPKPVRPPRQWLYVLLSVTIFSPSLTCHPSGPSLDCSNVRTCAERELSLIVLSALVMLG
ncbi:unnamed protein product [Penicillium nalgiovense]|nr:unnamed protein product [Penicillium nalgiovense]